MRRPLAILALVCACESEPAPAAAPAEPATPTLSAEEACAAYVAVPPAENVVTIAASVIASTIAPTSDGTGMHAQVTELRAETGPVENAERRIDGLRVVRKLTLTHDGSAWKVTADNEVTRDEIFYLYKSPDVDPRSLFGAQIVERYGPKSGTACTLPSAKK